MSRASLAKIHSNHTSTEEIEDAARELQIGLWKARGRGVVGSRLERVVTALEPSAAAEHLGFKVSTVDTLGVHPVGGAMCEVAGVLDRDANQVSVSRKFPYRSQRFTLGHEVAHILFDVDHRVLHRDVPLEKRYAELDWREARANRFSSALLMPRNLVEDQFIECFRLAYIEPSEEFAYALCGTSLHELRKRLKCKRDMSLAIAGCMMFNGRTFTPLVDKFKVSPLAMAIRLEELDLVRF